MLQNAYFNQNDGKNVHFVTFLKKKVFDEQARKLTDWKLLILKNFCYFFYVIKIKITIFPIYSNFEFKIAKNASQPIFEIFDKYYL